MSNKWIKKLSRAQLELNYKMCLRIINSFDKDKQHEIDKLKSEVAMLEVIIGRYNKMRLIA